MGADFIRRRARYTKCRASAGWNAVDRGHNRPDSRRLWLPGKEVDGRDPRDDTDHTPQHQTERERHRSATYMMSEQSRFFTPYLLPARRLDPTLDGQHPAVDGGDHRGVVGFGLVGVAPGECA